MTKQEFINLFNLGEVYLKYQNNIPFSLRYSNRLTSENNFILYFQDEESKFHLVVESTEFNDEPQKLELNLILNNETVLLNKDELFTNDLFPFLTFDTNFEAALNFLANFINDIVIPKYELKGYVSTYWIKILIVYNLKKDNYELYIQWIYQR